jgi:hypothetical protein
MARAWKVGRRWGIEDGGFVVVVVDMFVILNSKSLFKFCDNFYHVVK